MSLDASTSSGFGEFGPPHRVVAPEAWHDTLAGLHADGYTYFDWLSAVDEQREGFRLVAHVLRPNPWDHLLVTTMLDAESPAVASVADVYAGALWHQREAHEMFGIDFGVELEPLLLPDGFEGHPLRKDFVLASRVLKPWPGAKEPGESDHDLQSRTGGRRMKPPGVPDDWLEEDAVAGGEAAGPSAAAPPPAPETGARDRREATEATPDEDDSDE